MITPQDNSERHYDVIIVGGGFAGVLATRCAMDIHPQLKALLLEKDEVLGGRGKSSVAETRQWNHGLNTISQQLFDFLDQMIKRDPEAQDLASYTEGKTLMVGALGAGKVDTILMSKLFGPEGAHLIAGGPGMRDFAKMEQVITKYSPDSTKESLFSQSWPGVRKDPAALVLEHLSHLWGVPDLWSAYIDDIVQLGKAGSTPRLFGKWETALQNLLAQWIEKERVAVKTSCRVVGATYLDGVWKISSQQGEYFGKHMIVAQPPWEAINWVRPDFLPTIVISLSSKTKPVSVVTLSDRISKTPSSSIEAQVVLVPAEQTQVYIFNNTICCQATLDYELSLQAPSVVKAVRRLKRTRKKLLTAFDLNLEGDHLALLPVAWTYPASQNARKWLQKIGKDDIQAAHLTFCGDAYGQEVDGDANLVTSVQSAIKKLSETFGHKTS